MSGTVFLILRVLLTASLYAFLTWVILLMIKEIRQEGSILAHQKIPSIKLIIHHKTQQSQVSFFQSEIMIGRDAVCDCSIEDGKMSARHARLSYHHKQWWLEDLGSTNGTLIDQNPLEAPTVVTTGDTFSCGKTSFIIIINNGENILPEIQYTNRTEKAAKDNDQSL